MAKTKWWALWDIQSAGSAYNAVEAGKKFKKGETLGTEEPVKGLLGNVFTCKMVQLEAESGEEACLIASEAYGERGGVAAFPKAEKELEFKSA